MRTSMRSLTRIAEESLHIVGLILEVGGAPELDRELRRAALRSACMVYRLLESQAEADRMNAEMRDSSS